MSDSLPVQVLFDLDGTLIDSAPAILASFRQAFEREGVRPVRPIDESIIGPPLMETLAQLAGPVPETVLSGLAEAFKSVYDSSGFRRTLAYDGVTRLLDGLRAAGHELHIATNKRIHPTRLILDHLGWTPLFASVYALDLFEPRLADKAAMIGRLLADQGIERSSAVYVGDREEDGLSAAANDLRFVAATWGYGSLGPDELRAGWRSAATPAALLQMLAERTE